MTKRKDHKIYDQRNNERKINKATDLILRRTNAFKKKVKSNTLKI